jgi:NADPH2:quinone reductase
VVRVHDGTLGGFSVIVLTFSDFGGPEVLRVEERPAPIPGPGQVRIRVAAAGVNRADVLQRQGHYMPQEGEPAWPGLEVSGVIDAVGQGVGNVAPGDAVCALLGGGGYAEFCIAEAGLVLPVPMGLDLVEAAGLVEAACTMWSNLRFAGARPGDSILIHGGSGGIGSLGIQIAKAAGLHVLATARGPERTAACARLGADVAIDYIEDEFEEIAAAEGGVDIILDILGAVYLGRNIEALAPGGRLVVLGLQGGSHAEIDLGALTRKRASVAGTTLRSRPLEQKESIVADVLASVWPWVPGTVAPVIGATFPLEDAASAHAALESGDVFGKIVLTVPAAG